MKRHLLSYDEAVALTLGADAAFYESKFEIEGYSVSIFNYRIAQYSDFAENQAFEMRGLTFVFDKDGSLFNRYLLLHKFFNLNQVEETQYSLIKDFYIKSIHNKEDGSVASFIRLPNGSVLGKSKMSFDSEQAAGMNRLYKSKADLKRFVDWSLDNDYVAVFEYVAPSNRIVLKYFDEELILLRLRDNKTGEYLDLSRFSKEIGSLKTAPRDVATLDEIVERAKSTEDKEGWIIEFSNGLFIKVKTVWYAALHGLLTEDLYREHVLIRYVLEEKIDDVLGQIPEDDAEARARIEKIITVVKNAVSEKVKDINRSYKLFLEGGSEKDFNHFICALMFLIFRSWAIPILSFIIRDSRLPLMRKVFALKHGKERNFAYVMSLSRGDDVYALAKDWVSDQTRKLKIARDFLQERDPSIFFMDGQEGEI
jgi:T4 RnlA family RNA ligase